MPSISRKDMFVLVGAAVVTLALIAYFFFIHEPKNKDVLPELSEITLHQNWSFQTFSSYFQKLADVKGAPYAFDVLLRAEFPPDIDVHLLGHTVGGMLYKQQGINGIQLCTQDLRNACSHAVVIGALLEHGESALSDIVDACKEAPGGTGAYTMCFHGLGHGVLAYTDYNLEKAVAMCKKVGTPEYKNREYVECVGGAIMEMIDGVHDRVAWERQVGNYFRADDPLYPCDASFMPNDVRSICYDYLTPHLFTVAGMNQAQLSSSDFAEAFSYCRVLLLGSESRDACYGGFGKEFIAIAQERDVRDVGSMGEMQLKKIRTWCAQANDVAGEASCNAYALYSLFWGGENASNASFMFCTIAESRESQADCYQALSGQISQYLRGTLKGTVLCGKLPNAYQAQCRENTI